MSDFEDYTAGFFQECDELLDDLEERLGALAEGDRDPETVHAAFRAVHSIKGGADAFGYGELVTFAHVFEAVMYAIRSGRLAPAPGVWGAVARRPKPKRAGGVSPQRDLRAAARVAPAVSSLQEAISGQSTDK